MGMTPGWDAGQASPHKYNVVAQCHPLAQMTYPGIQQHYDAHFVVVVGDQVHVGEASKRVAIPVQQIQGQGRKGSPTEALRARLRDSETQRLRDSETRSLGR